MEGMETKSTGSSETSVPDAGAGRIEPLSPQPSRDSSSNDDGSEGGALARAPRSRARLVKTEPEDLPKNVANAPFVNKVWNMVNDPRNHKYIRWMPGGKSIEVVDREGFEKDLLPFYFKHKRFTSFVRQLNMYGWHKVQDINAGTMQSAEEHWQFASPYFVQDRPELLARIVRNKGAKVHAPAPEEDESGERAKDLKSILRELEQIKSRQANIGEDLGRIRRDNEMLWEEYYTTRERYDKHNQMLSRILRFLATVYGNQSKILDITNDQERLLRGDGRRQSYMQLLPAQTKHLAQEPAFDSGISELKEIERLQDQIQKAGPAVRARERALTPVRELVPRREVPSTARISEMRSPPNPPADGAQQPVPNLDIPLAATDPRVAPAVDTVPLSRGPQLQRQSTSPRIAPVRIPPSPEDGPVPRSPQELPLDLQLPELQELPDLNLAPTPLEDDQMVQPQLPPALHGPVANPHTISTSHIPQSMPQALIQPAAAAYTEHAGKPRSAAVLDDDPGKLFPELGELGMPSLTNHELEQISRDIATNGMSLQSIQDWLSRLPDGAPARADDDAFDVDEFLTEDAPEEKDAEAVGEPDRKRVRVV